VWTACHDHGVEVRVLAHDRRGFFLDDVSDAGIGKVASDGSNGRGREHDVADQSQPNQEDIQNAI
jgi:hypothetical protein